MFKYIIAIAVGIVMFSIIVLLFGKSVSKKDSVKNRLYNLGKEVNSAYIISDEDMSKPFTERVIKPTIHKLTEVLSTMLPVSKGKNGNEAQKKILQQAGWTISVEEYTVIQLIMMFGLGTLGFLAAFLLKVDAMHKLLYIFAGIFGGYTLLRFYTSSVASKRKLSMEKQLPDMLDLLSVSVAAGLGFERAMLHIIDTMDGPLIDEFAVTYREMSMGRSRKDALTLLGDRCGVEDLSSVTSALVQAGQLGIPMKNVLQSQSAAIRRSRKAKVQEKAAKISTKILLPMVGLIFPVLIIVLMGPSIITIMEQFK
ncbi:MAG: type II secretion system F family protein [Clostridia bacterium]|nr:type II secretion system F family protein [Clostridia bacterium]